MSAISANLSTPPDNFSTTLSSGIASNALSIPLNSVAGLPTEGIGVLFTKDANGDVVAGSVEIIHWTGVAGSALTLTNTGDRGLTGSDGAAQAYSAGAYFEVWVTSYYYDSLLDGIAAGDVAVATVAASSKSTPVDADLIPLVDSAASNVLKQLSWANLKATLKTYFDTLYPPYSGWRSYSTVTPTYTSADDPTYTITFAAVDLTSVLSVGMKVKFTNNSTTFYGFITAISFSTNTVVTLYGGTDYDVANSAITAFQYSTDRAPQGFPMNPDKWTVSVSDTNIYTQASPVAGTWYNLGTTANQISLPIGVWRVMYKAQLQASNATSVTTYITLSTANNSESDTDMTRQGEVSGSASVRPCVAAWCEKIIAVAAKTTYYLNEKVGTSSLGNLWIRGDNEKTIIRAVCAYL